MLWVAAVLLAAVGGGHGHQTTQTVVAEELRECYMDPLLLNRNNLAPTTMSVLIDIIRKIENNPNVNMDLRQLSSIILHTYRQDGIEYHQSDSSTGTSSFVLPYAPTFHSFHRHRLLLSRLIPNNLQVLANNTLSSSIKCTLHNMLSTTVDARVRGDENTCSQLSQYRAMRTVRSLSSSINDDVEVLDPSLLMSSNRNGQMRQYNPKNDIEYTSNVVLDKSQRQLLGDSLCPILRGVVSSPWGAVSAGNLIAGIAAGAELQRVPVLDLVKGTRISHPNVQSTVTSIYPATVSGDLAEAVLIQGTDRRSTVISIGAAGNWNSSQATKYYMLNTRLNVEMTDPEIRGDIDGFVLGNSITNILGVYSSLRLSQLLDMYYSPTNGVFESTLRACNRRTLSQQHLTNENLESETYAFAAALDTNIPLSGTFTGNLLTLVSNAVTNFQTYVSSNLNDMPCTTTESQYHDFRMKTNLYIVLDSTWQYQAVYPAISFLLDSLEVGKYGSSVTLLSAFDGSIVVNTTFSLADFHTEYTVTKHQSMFTGVNLQTTYTNIKTMMHSTLQNEININYVGGNSTVLLFLLNSGNLQNNAAVWEEARIINETVPDLRVIYATSSNQFDNLWNLVRDPYNDIFTISLSTTDTNTNTVMQSVLSRIQQVGRRIINPTCGYQYNGGSSGTRQFDDFVEPGYINFYAISPNYFYEHNDNRLIRISRSSAGVGSLIICHSRTVAQPRRNATLVGLDENAITCETLASTGNIEIRLPNACDNYWTINSCPLFYLSIQSNNVGSTASSAVCTDVNVCRFPYNIRYQVQIEEFGCFSGASSINISFGLLLSVLLVIFSQ